MNIFYICIEMPKYKKHKFKVGDRIVKKSPDRNNDVFCVLKILHNMGYYIIEDVDFCDETYQHIKHIDENYKLDIGYHRNKVLDHILG